MPIWKLAPSVHVLRIVEVDSTNLLPSGLWKIHSLIESSRFEVSIPKTLVVVDLDMKSMLDFTSRWHKPILRMDYINRPPKKFIGGIPVSSKTSFKGLLKFLKEHNYYPFLHPYLNRFRNIYSAGVRIERESTTACVEILGPGFDASDLRLGLSIPHEVFETDIFSGGRKDIYNISQEDYTKSRQERLQRRFALRAYSVHANLHMQLCSDLGKFNKSPRNKLKDDPLVPKTYIPITEDLIQSLMRECRIILNNVIGRLPFSVGYVASFSFFAEKGWILWDVYGQWYQR